MCPFKVVITDLGYASYDIEKSELSPVGAELTLAQCKTEADVATACRDADGVITRLAPVGADAIRQMTKARVISRYGVGVDNVHVATATERGIPVANVREYCNEEVSDHALALLMACIRKVSVRDRQVRAGQWDIGAKNPVHRIAGHVLGLVGYGAIARALHRKVSGFGLKEVLAFDPFVSTEDMAHAGVRKCELMDLLAQADYISVHAPLTPETRHLIGAAQFAVMKKTAILVNTSRGPLIDEEALYQTLRAERINSAGIDVYEKEPPPEESRLFGLDNIVLTDHTGWYSEESQQELQRLAARNVARVLSGQPPLFCVNPQVLKK